MSLHLPAAQWVIACFCTVHIKYITETTGNNDIETIIFSAQAACFATRATTKVISSN